jgi:hypothetical protein
MKLIQEMRY